MDPIFTQYLAAKKNIDDRALNRAVWEGLVRRLPHSTPERPLRVLEAGCGIGTMIERMLQWGMSPHLDYRGFDADPTNIAWAANRFPEQAALLGFQSERLREPSGPGWMLRSEGRTAVVRLEVADLFDQAPGPGEPPGGFDLVVAHAFLDLVDITSALPILFDRLDPGGQFYFTLNFDGATTLEPASQDPDLDARIENLYHRTMDERLAGGRPSGDSRSGRHLFAHLQAAGARVLDAGASDWVVFPHPQGYSADESFFLHSILDMIELALRGRPGLDLDGFEQWVAERRRQVESGGLIYIAHQLDFAGIWPGQVA